MKKNQRPGVDPMKLANLTLIVTDDCNYHCSYCFQKKQKNYLNHEIIKRAVDFFYPFFIEDGDVYIVFYGGEPLLAFGQIEYAVSLIRKKNKVGRKKIIFSLTTNGSPVTEKMLRYLNAHRFSVMLSCDGLAQDISRKPGTMLQMQDLIGQFLSPAYSGIKFSSNSVFTPATIPRFFESLRYIIELGVPEVQFSLNTIEPWNRSALTILEKELKKLADYLLFLYKDKGTIPVVNYRNAKSSPGKGFFCSAGRDRISVSPNGDVHGCFLFHDYLTGKEASEDYRNYSFGKLDHFIKRFDSVYPAIIENYSILRQSSFFSDEQFCFLCDAVKECRVCPVIAAHSTSFIGKIPTRICTLNRIKEREKKKFHETKENLHV